MPDLLHRLLGTGTDLARLRDPAHRAGRRSTTRSRGAPERGAFASSSTYGLTETCGGIAYDGRLFDETDARIDATGGLELHGPTLMEGYRHDPAATAKAFTLDGWLRTGDAGAVEPDGRLRIDGRMDEAIRTGAETVWPQEVEDALADHPKVSDVAVAGRAHEEWGQQVVAFVVPASGDDPPTPGGAPASTARSGSRGSSCRGPS